MAIEIAALASTAVSIVAPALRYLLSRAGKRAGDQAADEIGDEAWAAAKRVWGTIGPKVESDPGARDMARDLAIDPDDDSIRTDLEEQLLSILQHDRRLVQRLDQDVRILQNTGQITNIRADRSSLAAGRDIRVSGGLRIGSGDSQMELWQNANGPAKAIMAIGFLAAMIGIGGFILMIALSFGSTDGPDTSLLGGFFALGIVGMLVAGVGSLFALLTMRR
jgi:hypothetical protein